MAREWTDLFITGERPVADAAESETATPDLAPDTPPDAAPAPDDGAKRSRGGMFARLRENLRKTREAVGAEIRATLFDELDEAAWERLEELLIYADLGARTTAAIVARLEDEVRAAGGGEGGPRIVARLEALLAEAARVGEPAIDLRPHPTVILVTGVNGTGKTTSAGKIAWHLQRELGRSVLLGAADTYRAAAGEQLAEWARRAGCEIVAGGEGSDPGAVAFDTVAAAKARGVDVALIDTAGRLHTQDHLLEELKKIRRVIAKQLPDAPHETLLTIDATTGQNGLRQAKLFSEAIPIDGVILTKLDGTAKGGIALAIAAELGIPVKLIGIGESLEDLRPFDPGDFARALLAE